MLFDGLIPEILRMRSSPVGTFRFGCLSFHWCPEKASSWRYLWRLRHQKPHHLLFTTPPLDFTEHMKDLITAATKMTPGLSPVPAPKKLYMWLQLKSSSHGLFLNICRTPKCHATLLWLYWASFICVIIVGDINIHINNTHVDMWAQEWCCALDHFRPTQHVMEKSVTKDIVWS